MAAIRAFTMPKWGIEMTEGTVAEWMVAEGDSFTRGQTLALIETDKITNEVEAEFDGTLRRVVAAVGGTLPVGALLGVFADADASDADIAAFMAKYGDAAAPASGEAGVPAKTIPSKIETNRAISPQALAHAEQLGVDLAGLDGSGRHGRITFQDVDQASRPVARAALAGPLDMAVELERFYASPLARRLAGQHGIDLAGIKGSGKRGRIAKADVLALVKQVVAAMPVPFVAGDNRPRIVPMDKIRKVVARRLTEAKATIPHYYLRASFAVDDLLALRKTANLVLGCKASINDYLVRAAGLALARHADVNIQVHGDAIHHFAHADIAVAVATDQALLTPIVRAADLMRIEQIAAATKALVARAQAGKLGYAEMDGGTFTISNLGMFGIDQFDAIINPPQGAILAVGGIARLWAEGPDGQGRFESRIALTLSCDHRAIDGAAGARFMATLKGLIEAPEGLFAV